MLASGEIEIAPLAFMRGRTLTNAFVIIDEAQNTTPVQMKMVLTRLGEDSRMIITGDLSQIDLPSGQLSGLSDAVNRLELVKGIGIFKHTFHIANIAGIPTAYILIEITCKQKHFAHICNIAGIPAAYILIKIINK